MADIDVPGLPTNWEGCIVTGRFVYSDGSAIPVDKTVFSLTMTPGNVRDSAAPKTVIIGVPIIGKLAADGNIRGLDGLSTGLGVVIAASDDPDINPSGFTYTFAFSDPDMGRAFEPFSFVAPWNGTVDLLDVASVLTSDGTFVIVGPRGLKGDKGDVGTDVNLVIAYALALG